MIKAQDKIINYIRSINMWSEWRNFDLKRKKSQTFHMIQLTIHSMLAKRLRMEILRKEILDQNSTKKWSNSLSSCSVGNFYYSLSRSLCDNLFLPYSIDSVQGTRNLPNYDIRRQKLVHVVHHGLWGLAIAVLYQYYLCPCFLLLLSNYYSISLYISIPLIIDIRTRCQFHHTTK